MIFKHFFGVLSFKVSGADAVKLLNALRKSTIACKSVYCENDNVFGEVYATERKQLCEICTSLGGTLDVISGRGLILKLYKYRKRFGVILGSLFALCLAVYFSNIVLRVEITGCADELKPKIIQILEQEGLTSGRFIPALDFFRIEQRLKLASDEISFANVRSFAGTVTVNVSEATPTPEITPYNHLPTNIVSTKDAEIVKVEVLAGQLMELVGSGVKKGELLVSGLVEDGKGNVHYYHSIANIYGKFEENVIFTQPFCDVAEHITESADSRSYFSFFDIDVPMFFGKAPQGNFVQHEYREPLRLFGLTLPLGVTKVRYDSFEFTESEYTYEEALTLANQQMVKYEQNFLSNAEILTKEVKEAVSDSEVTLSVRYVVIDKIGTEKEIMLK